MIRGILNKAIETMQFLALFVGVWIAALSPLVVPTAIFAAVSFRFGIWGGLLALPLAVFVQVVLVEWVSTVMRGKS